jgi:hypothetical protein
MTKNKLLHNSLINSTVILRYILTHADFFSCRKFLSMSFMQLTCQLITINKNNRIHKDMPSTFAKVFSTTMPHILKQAVPARTPEH